VIIVNKYTLIALIIAAGVACFLFTDKIMEIIAGALLLGGGSAVADAKKKGQEASQEAEIYDDMGVVIREDVMEAIDEINAEHNEIINIAEDITDPKNKPKPGSTRRKFTSS